MLYLVKGTPDSGKSKRAEEIVCNIGSDLRYYIATMIPYGEEGRKRVNKHRQMRSGKGFVTIELPYDITEGLNVIENPDRATVLVECMSNLVANLYFDRKYSEDKVIELISGQVLALSSRLANLVLVTNEFDADNNEYDQDTINYISLMSSVNEQLEKIVDSIEVIGL